MGLLGFVILGYILYKARGHWAEMGFFALLVWIISIVLRFAIAILLGIFGFSLFYYCTR